MNAKQRKALKKLGLDRHLIAIMQLSVFDVSRGRDPVFSKKDLVKIIQILRDNLIQGINSGNKNDRQTRHQKKTVTYYDLEKVPPYLASKKEWRRRGYAVIEGQPPVGNVENWIGNNWLRFELYHYYQTRLINGKKATERRYKWLHGG